MMTLYKVPVLMTQWQTAQMQFLLLQTAQKVLTAACKMPLHQDAKSCMSTAPQAMTA